MSQTRVIQALLPNPDEWEDAGTARELYGWHGPVGDQRVAVRKLTSGSALPEPTADDRRFTRGRVVELERCLREFASGTWTDETITRANELLDGGRRG